MPTTLTPNISLKKPDPSAECGYVPAADVNDNMDKIDAAIITLPAGAVTTALLDALAVTTEKIATGAVTAAKIATGAVEATHIATGAVSAEELADDAVTEDAIADDAVTAGKVLDAELLPCGLDVPDTVTVSWGTSVFARSGNLIIATLPTTDPTTAGALWNDSGTLKISTGS